MENLNYLLAFTGGLISVTSPCILPVLPSFIAYLGGLSFNSPEKNTEKKLNAVLHALMLSLGFSFVFFIFGTVAGFLGKFFLMNQMLILQIGGVIIILFGISQLGFFSLEKIFPKFYLRQNPEKKTGLLSSFLIGCILAFTWAPCYGPIIGTIFTLASTTTTYLQSILFFFFYSLGFTLPLILLALFFEHLSVFFKKNRLLFLIISRTAGVILIVIGFFMLTGMLPQLANFLDQLYIKYNLYSL